MNNFKDFLIEETATQWVASKMLSGVEYNEAVKLYKKEHPGDESDVSFDKVRRSLKRKSLFNLAKNENYTELSKRLEKLSKSGNAEVAKKAAEILPKVNGLIAASAVTEASVEEIKAEIQDVSKIIDDLILNNNEDTPETRLSNVEALTKMKNIYKELYNKYHSGDLQKAVVFLNSVAKISKDRKTMSWEELVLGWKKVLNGEKFDGESYPKSGKIVQGIKFLLGCLVLKYSLKSDIFGGQGIKVLEKDGIVNDANVNDAISSLRAVSVDKSVADNFTGINSSEKFLSGLEGVFKKLNKIVNSENKEAEAPKEEPKKEEPKKEEPKAEVSKEELKKEEPKAEAPKEEPKKNDDDFDEPEEKKGEVASSNPELFKTGFKVFLQDKPETVEKKVQDYFGDENTNGKALDSYIDAVEEFRASLKKKETVNESILDEGKLSALGATLKNNLGNVGRFWVNGDSKKVNDSIDKSIEDMKNFKQIYLAKAVKLRDIIASPIQSTSNQEKAINKLNLAAIEYNGKLRDCLVHAQSRNSLNEVGRTIYDAKDAVSKVANSDRIKNSRTAKIMRYDNERIENVAKNFGSVWAKLGNPEKRLLAHAILRNDEKSLRGSSVLMINRNGQMIPVTNAIASLTNLVQADGSIDLKNEGEVYDFLGKIQNSEWFKFNKGTLDRFEKEYAEFEKAYGVISKSLPGIIRQAQQNLNDVAKNNRRNFLKKQAQKAANTPEREENPENAQNIPAREASVITESVSPEYAKRVYDFMQNPLPEKVGSLSGIFGNFSNEAVYNGIMKWLSIPENKAMLNPQATVTTGSVGTVYPQNVYAKAIRRKLNPYSF